MTTRVKDWGKFQHFKDRRPPWIKLYRDILDDLEWHELDAESAKGLVMIWLIASEYDGELPNTKTLAFRLRMSETECKSLISKLSHWLEQDDSAVISACYQDDLPEEETETETEREQPARKVRKAREQTLPAWLTALDGEVAILAEDPIYEWADKTGIPADWLAIAWWVFEARYVDGVKTYADWRAVFRKACREDWLKVWRLDNRDGKFVLTTAGESARREMESLA